MGLHSAYQEGERRMNRHRGAILMAAFLGGFASLTYELIWTRYLALLLGSTAYALGVITACYMAGLALGSFLLGRLGERWEWRAAACAFGGFGVLCALSPLIYQGVGALSLTLSRGVEGGALLAVRVLAAALGLLIPTACIGGMTPVLMKAYRRERDSALVYALFTLGSILGAAAEGFFLLPTLGLSGSALVGGACALVGLACLKGREGGTVPIREKGRMLEKPYPERVRRYTVFLYSVSGFTAMAYQMYQTRLLTLFFMDSVYDFTLILTVFLAGLFLGNCLGDILAQQSENDLFWLGLGQGMVGLMCLGSLVLTNRLPFWTDGIATVPGLAAGTSGNPFLRGLLLKSGCCALAVLPPTVLWGSVFPLAVKVFLRGRDSVSTGTGVLTGWNTVGSALGSIMGSFLLVGLLGLRGSIILGAVLNVMAAIGCVLVGQRELNKRYRAGIWGLSAAALLTALLLPPWDKFEMSTSFLKPGQDVSDVVELLYYREDAGGITSVVHFQPNNEKYLTTNRLYCQSTADLGGPEDHRRLGCLPLLLHSDSQDVLVMGLGSGVTLRGVVEAGDGQIDCVEISPAVVEAANCFRVENGAVLEQDNVNIIAEDARNYILRTEKTYDVVIGDIFFPMSSGSSGLFSQEYYESVLGRLNEGGLMVQWLPLHQFTRREMELTADTFARVFPYSYYILGMIGTSVPAVGLVGSEAPLTVNLERLWETYRTRPELAETLGEIALDDPYMLLSHYIGRITPGQGPVATDDRPMLEYMNPREISGYQERARENLTWLLDRKNPAREITRCSKQEERVLDEYDRMIVEFVRDYVLPGL